MPDNEPNWGHFFGLGMQVAVGVVVGLAVGRWLDQRYNWAGRATLIGMLVGLAGGMYLLIRDGIRANRDQ